MDTGLGWRQYFLYSFTLKQFYVTYVKIIIFTPSKSSHTNYDIVHKQSITITYNAEFKMNFNIFNRLLILMFYLLQLLFFYPTPITFTSS